MNFMKTPSPLAQLFHAHTNFCIIAVIIVLFCVV